MRGTCAEHACGQGKMAARGYLSPKVMMVLRLSSVLVHGWDLRKAHTVGGEPWQSQDEPLAGRDTGIESVERRNEGESVY